MGQNQFQTFPLMEVYWILLNFLLSYSFFYVFSYKNNIEKLFDYITDFAFPVSMPLYNAHLFITLLLGPKSKTMLAKQLCCIQTKMYRLCQPQWLSWMRRPTGDQEVAGSTPAEVGNILSWRLIVKSFLRSFSPFHWFKNGSGQFLAKECAQYWFTA